METARQSKVETARESKLSAISAHNSLLTARALSSILCISQRTVRRWVREGHFPRPTYLGPYGAPRWHPHDVIAYVQSSARRPRRSRVRKDHAGSAELAKDGRPRSHQGIPGTVSQGMVIPDAPLPDGARVEIRVTDGL
jgi:predicted DNA-binding transcriptional regulator AlpA